MKLNRVLATCILPLVAACGGGSTGGSSFSQLAAEGDRLVTLYGNATPTNPASMPVGTATYRGVAAYSSSTSDPSRIVETARTVSALELTANFDADTINGRAYNFQVNEPALPGITMSGQLDISNGIISGNGLQANISGVLTERYQNISLPVTYNGTLSGAFVGSNAQAIAGTGAAIGTFDGRAYGGSANETVTSYAVFGAER